MKIHKPLLLVLLALIAIPALAQDRDGIQNAFLNRRVWLKVDLPGTQLGIDVYPQYQNPFPSDYDTLLRQYPLAYHRGETATVTKINFKKDHIEFQFDHGGWGQFGDNTDVMPVTWTQMPQSNDEIDLRRKIANDDNDVSSRVVDKQLLDILVQKRQEADARAKANAQAATDAKVRFVHDARVRGGSRLNITYSDRVPENLTAHDVEMAIAPFVSFNDPRNTPRSSPAPEASGSGGHNMVYGPTPAPAPAPAPTGGGLQKGMSFEQVHRMLGSPTSTSSKDTEFGKATTELYVLGGQVITATYMDGILLKSEMTSR